MAVFVPVCFIGGVTGTFYTQFGLTMAIAVAISAVLLNAGAALYIGGKADSFKNGVELAKEIIDSGKALETLEKFILLSNEISEDKIDEISNAVSGAC